MKLKLVEASSIGKPRLDRDRGVVHDVKILGYKSAHGYTYTSRAMKGAVELYEGVRVNVNHPDRRNLNADRKYQDRFGRFKNVRFEEGRGLYGDFHYNRGHAVASQFEWDVENDPKACGFSHNAGGSAYKEGGKVFVESIDKVRSVDLVADPATNVGLFESRGVKYPMKIRLKKRRLAESRRDRRRASSAQRKAMHHLNEFLEAAAIQPDPEDGGSNIPTTKEAMAQMLQAVFMDDSLDAAAKKDKILAILELEEKTESSDEASAEGDSSSSSSSSSSGKSSSNLNESRGARSTVKPKKKPGKPAEKKELTESKVEELANELKAMKHEKRVLQLCESSNFRPSKVQLAAIMALPSKKEAKELIESFAEGSTRRRPKGVKSATSESSRQPQEVKTENWLEGLVSGDPGETFRQRRQKRKAG